MTFIGSFMTELGAHPEIVGKFSTVNGQLHFGNGIIDKLATALEMFVPHKAGKPVETLFKIGQSTTPAANGTDFVVASSGILDVKYVTTNHATTYQAATIEMKSNVDDSVLATKAAGTTNFVFKTNVLPVVAGVSLAGKDITTITVPQLAHAIDLRAMLPLVNMVTAKLTEAAPIMSTNLLGFNVTKDAYKTQGVTEFLGVTIDPVTHLFSVNGLGTNPSATDKEAYDTALTEFVYQVSGMPELFNELDKSGKFAGTQAAGMITPIKSQEQHKRE